MAYTINLTHRGPQVIECIDLFDEARYGADKLFFRGRFEKKQDIIDQVTFALTANDSSSEYGNGNPLKEGDSIPNIALNRYYIPNKKFWNNVVPSDVEDPHKASAAVKFSIRVHFRDDFAYIDFGCPWEFTEKYNGETLNADSSSQDFIEKFILLQCHFISKEDALQILNDIFPNVSKNTAEYPSIRSKAQILIETTELVDEDGSLISL